jgi:quercetin dioxygenase-like cupin family protein
MITNVSHRQKFSFNGVSFTVYHVNKGEGIPKHEHPFNHLTICNVGSVAIRKENKEVIADKDSGAFNLPANQWHEIEALKDGTVFVNISAEGNY